MGLVFDSWLLLSGIPNMHYIGYRSTGIYKKLFQCYKIPGCSQPKTVREIKPQKCFSQKQSHNKVIEKSNNFFCYWYLTVM